MHSTLKLQILTLAFTALWSTPVQTRDFKIHINDLPWLIFDPGDNHHDTTFTLGPKEHHPFYENLQQRTRDRETEEDLSFYRPFIIGPPYRNYELSHWLASPDSSVFISIFHEYLAFERIENIFLIWERIGDSLVFNCVPDTIVSTGMGNIFLEEIHQLQGGRYLVIGSGSGGDAGDGWQSVWFAEWDGACSLNGFYELSSRTEQCYYREYLMSEFDALTFVATLTKRHDRVIDCKDEYQPVYDDSVIVTTERVEILKLIK